MLSHVWLFATSRTVAHQAPLSMRISRQKYWSGLPFPPPEDLPDPGIEPESPALAGKFFTTEPPGKPLLTGTHSHLKHSPFSFSPHPSYVICYVSICVGINSMDRAAWRVTVHGVQGVERDWLTEHAGVGVERASAASFLYCFQILKMFFDMGHF